MEGQRNARLRAARERLPSRRVPGEPLSRAELADLVNAWLSGHVYGFQRAVADAEQAHADADLTAEPRWLQGLDRAELAGVIGSRYRDLACHDPGQARHAITYIGRALAWRDPGKARNRAFDLVSLARVYPLAGEHEEAASTVRQALPLLNRRRPGRLARKLSDWRREAEPFDSVTVVRDVRADIADLNVVQGVVRTCG